MYISCRLCFCTYCNLFLFVTSDCYSFYDDELLTEVVTFLIFSALTMEPIWGVLAHQQCALTVPALD